MKIAPSILSADFSKLGEEIRAVEDSADLIHVDVMDGHFVPNITLGPCVLASLKSRLPMDVHLMIESPEKFIDEFAKAGADYITIHAEVCNNLKACINQIKEAGCKAGVSIKPATPVSDIIDILPYLDLILVMTVEPGFGGQELIPAALEKIQMLRKHIDTNNLKTLIEADGGINEKTARIVAEAGVDIAVAGSAVYNKQDYKQAILALKNHN
ncbi:ribulose-phosphate 3-epimerase [Candidatus Woesearchaeota archaeon]|nr:ribulose-phosphate 3-epimerase [Candidatus Woesearchaeota archaeon]